MITYTRMARNLSDNQENVVELRKTTKNACSLYGGRKQEQNDADTGLPTLHVPFPVAKGRRRERDGSQHPRLAMIGPSGCSNERKAWGCRAATRGHCARRTLSQWDLETAQTEAASKPSDFNRWGAAFKKARRASRVANPTVKSAWGRRLATRGHKLCLEHLCAAKCKLESSGTFKRCVRLERKPRGGPVTPSTLSNKLSSKVQAGRRRIPQQSL